MATTSLVFCKSLLWNNKSHHCNTKYEKIKLYVFSVNQIIDTGGGNGV